MKSKDASHCPSCGTLCSKSDSGAMVPLSQEKTIMRLYELQNEIDILKAVSGPNYNEKGKIVSDLIKLARRRRLSTNTDDVNDRIIDLVYDLERLSSNEEKQEGATDEK